MDSVLLLLCGSIIMMTVAFMLVSAGNTAKAFVPGIAAMALLLLLVFIVAPFELGYGRVLEVAEKFTKRLDVGREYKLIATEPVDDKDEKVLLVRDESSLDYYAIRVKIAVPMPEHFTLING